RGPRALRRARDRHVRLRDADAAGTPRDGARARSGEALARGPGEVALAHEHRAADGGLPVSHVRAGLDARLLALPAAQPRAHGPAAADTAQPGVRAARGR